MIRNKGTALDRVVRGSHSGGGTLMLRSDKKPEERDAWQAKHREQKPQALGGGKERRVAETWTSKGENGVKGGGTILIVLQVLAPPSVVLASPGARWKCRNSGAAPDYPSRIRILARSLDDAFAHCEIKNTGLGSH